MRVPGLAAQAPAGPGHVRRLSPTQRALRVLGCFSTARPELTLTELSRGTGLPMSTTHRVVGELVQWEALVRGQNGRYHVGVRLCEVAASSPSAAGLREIAWPFLEDVFEATRETVLLAVRDGLDTVFLARLSGRESMPVFCYLGRRRNLTTTSAGLVLLAHSPTEVQEEVLSGPLPRFTAKTVTDPHALRSVLAEIRRCGHSVSDGAMSLTSASCAAPVRDGDGNVVAALGAVVNVEDVNVRTLVPVLMASARGISRALGAPAPRRTNGGQGARFSA
ncbi:IclR family transcriptional regulator [Geodermatophilus sabuli]|uniref:IclR family transcriptional regulator n=1 Tax=Geodermatophilus sabuli TaxID=1564158 RepID=A0A7K3VZ41_9ACTN|nr:IclR family transcriptional regulator [Geodermatophilus sabuli]